ncbi:MAG: hypothetical protein Q9159_006442 [Coniocarpon cinnabarinum]
MHDPINRITRHTFQIEEGWEYLDNYASKGFCPIHLGDRLNNGTYTVVHKLGFGSSSTVWLARNTRHGSDPEKYPYRYVALKILRASLPIPSPETSIFTSLQSSFKGTDLKGPTEENGQKDVEKLSTPATHNHPRIIRLIHTFTHKSYNGIHEVLVFPVVRRLNELMINFCQYGRLWDNMSRDYCSIARQLFEAAAFLQQQGVVHGDIVPENVGYLCDDLTDYDVGLIRQPELRSTWLWRYHDEAPTAHSAISSRVRSNFPPDQLEKIPKDICDRLPKYMARVYEWTDESHKFERYKVDPRIVVFDFSHAFTKDTPQGARLHIATPLQGRAPEYVFPTHKMDTLGDVDAPVDVLYRYHGDYRNAFGDVCESIDVWGCGCTIRRLLSMGLPFAIAIDGLVAALKVDPHVSEDWKRMKVMRDAIGRVDGDLEQASSKDWEDCSNWLRSCIERHVQDRQEKGIPIPSNMELDALPQLVELLKFALRLDPRVRPSAAEVVRRLPEFLTTYIEKHD